MDATGNVSGEDSIINNELYGDVSKKSVLCPSATKEIGNVCMQATLKETETEMCKLFSSS